MSDHKINLKTSSLGCVRKKNELQRIGILAVTLVLVAVNIWGIYAQLDRSGQFGDARLRWAESAYLFSGIDPADIISGQMNAVKEIGLIPSNAGTVPWAYSLGGIFSFGLFSWDTARLGFILLNLVSCALATSLTYVTFTKKFKSPFIGLLGASLILINPYWQNALASGNQGGWMACLVIASIMIVDQKPWAAGLLLGVALMKPQLAFPFFIAYIIAHKYKAVFMAGGITATAWLMSALAVKASPFEMLSALSKSSVSNFPASTPGWNHFGAFGYFAELNIMSRSLALSLSIVSGLLLLLIGTYLIQKYPMLKQEPLSLYALAAFVSSVWFYKQYHDQVILALIALVSLIALVNQAKPMSYGLYSVFIGMIALYCFPQKIMSALHYLCLIYSESNIYYFAQYYILIVCWLLWTVISLLLLATTTEEFDPLDSA